MGHSEETVTILPLRLHGIKLLGQIEFAIDGLVQIGWNLKIESDCFTQARETLNWLFQIYFSFCSLRFFSCTQCLYNNACRTCSFLTNKILVSWRCRSYFVTRYRFPAVAGLGIFIFSCCLHSLRIFQPWHWTRSLVFPRFLINVWKQLSVVC